MTRVKCWWTPGCWRAPASPPRRWSGAVSAVATRSWWSASRPWRRRARTTCSPRRRAPASTSCVPCSTRCCGGARWSWRRLPCRCWPTRACSPTTSRAVRCRGPCRHCTTCSSASWRRRRCWSPPRSTCWPRRPATGHRWRPPAGPRRGELEQLAATLRAGFPRQRLLLQDSRTAAGVAAWLGQLEMDSRVAAGGAAPTLEPGVEVDYEQYGAAEAALAWNDREVELSGVEGRATEAARAVIDGVAAALQRRQRRGRAPQVPDPRPLSRRQGEHHGSRPAAAPRARRNLARPAPATRR